LDLDDLKELLRLMKTEGLTELELEKDGFRVRIKKPSEPIVDRKAVSAPSAGGTAPQAAATEVRLAAGAAGPEDSEDSGLTIVKSPIVGTFFRSPDPSADPFVAIGDHVTVGQVLCIVEAMKLMNEIEAETAGEIVAIHPENGQPVQYGEPLFSLRPA
jgi:acetyl-CoA carboxylase biotin carboxyl carrier protein